MRLVVSLLVFLGFSVGAFAEPQNLMLLEQEVIAYHDSGAYDKELTDIIQKAQAYIHAKALNNQKSSSPKRLAIVLDIDETSLSNYPKMSKRHFHATREVLHAETMAADAPVIKPMLELYNQAIQDNVAVFFVTGRRLNEEDATIKNLEAQGFKGWSGLYLRPADYQEHSMVPFKAGIRKMITEKGYDIIATIGDQRSDIEGGYAQHGFKLPNPYYHLP